MITVIPCKVGSVRVPLKNLRDVGGYPLVMWSVAAARLLGYPTYVMTDSPDVDELMMGVIDGVYICEQKGDKFLIDTICTDLRQNPDVIYLRPTTPFRDINVLKWAVECFGKYGVYSMRSAHGMADPAGKMYEWRVGFKPLTGSHDEANKPSQEMRPTFHPNGYIDITKTDRLNEGLFLEPFHMFSTLPTIEIDTEEDLFMAQEYVNHKGHPLQDYMRAIF